MKYSITNYYQGQNNNNNMMIVDMINFSFKKSLGLHCLIPNGKFIFNY